MIIQHADTHTWIKKVCKNPLELYGKSSRLKTHALLQKCGEYGITTTIEPLNEDFLLKFIPLYVESITKKSNPRIADVRAKTINNTEHSFPYFGLSLFQNNVFIGGTIFSLRDTELSIAYRTYSHSWINTDTPATPSLLTEYIIAQHAYEQGKETILHGKDKNPYGLNSSIGLAAFKLSVGCTPMLSKASVLTHTNSDDLTVDALILEYPQNSSQYIQKAYLVTPTPEKWIQVCKYPNLLQVEVIPRN